MYVSVYDTVYTSVYGIVCCAVYISVYGIVCYAVYGTVLGTVYGTVPLLSVTVFCWLLFFVCFSSPASVFNFANFYVGLCCVICRCLLDCMFVSVGLCVGFCWIMSRYLLSGTWFKREEGDIQNE